MRCKESVQDRVNTSKTWIEILYPSWICGWKMGSFSWKNPRKKKPLIMWFLKNSNFFNGVKVAFLSNGCSFQVAAFESFEMLIDLQYQWKRLRLRSSEAAVLLRKLIQMTLQLDNSYTILNPNSTQFVSPSLSSLPFFPPKEKANRKAEILVVFRFKHPRKNSPTDLVNQQQSCKERSWSIGKTFRVLPYISHILIHVYIINDVYIYIQYIYMYGTVYLNVVYIHCKCAEKCNF